VIQSNEKVGIVVSATLAGAPDQGGWAWAVLQYLLGFRKLGHDVHFLEPISLDALQPAGAELRQSRNAEYFRAVLGTFGFSADSTLCVAETRETIGLAHAELLDVLRNFDVLINLSGTWKEHDLAADIPVRVYVDLDPAYTQLWQHVQQIDMNLQGHTHYLTVGPEIGNPSCAIPTCGVQWLATRPPVFLDRWPMANGFRHQGLTSVANWRGYGTIEYRGELYGQKAHSFRDLIDLPLRTGEPLIMALGIHSDEVRDLLLLRENGWRLLDPVNAAGTAADFQHFVQTSKGELGIAKSGYVKSQCGWFSDRSVCYLASGRPVIAQETGFSRHLPTGEGLLTFTTVDEAVACIDAVNGDYARHSRAARRLAETYFDSGAVLSSLLRRVGAIS
jgi:hypothetical protein